MEDKFAERNVERVVDKIEDNIAPSTKEILLKLDPFLAVASSAVPSLIIKANENHPTNEEIVTEKIDLGWTKTGKDFHDWTPNPPEITTHEVSDTLDVKIIREDDNFGEAGLKFDIAAKTVAGSFLFPFDDHVFPFKDQAEADQLIKDTKLGMGMACPDTYNTWGDMSSDESFERYFWNGFGAVALLQQKETSDSEYGPFVVDMPVHEFKVRKGYVRKETKHIIICKIFFLSISLYNLNLFLNIFIHSLFL